MRKSLLQIMVKVTHFDSGVLHKLCWECFSELNDAKLRQMLTLVSPYSATLLWLVFSKLDNDGKLLLHPEVMITCMYMYCQPVITMNFY